MESSSIAAIGYDRGARVLVVTFKSGGTYAYVGVPRAIYEGFRQAKLAGRFFTSQVRDRFSYVKNGYLETARRGARQDPPSRDGLNRSDSLTGGVFAEKREALETKTH